MINAYRFILLTLFALLYAGCGSHKAIVLHREDVQNFTIKESREHEKRYITIRGLAFHSSMAVEGIEIKTNQADMLLEIILIPAREEFSGNFDFSIEIPSTVKNVYFGSMNYRIWPEQ